MLALLDKIPFGTPRLRRIGFWLLTAFTLYIIAGFLILPPVMKDIVISESESALGRNTSIDKVFFNPLTLHLEVDGFRVAQKDGEGDLISIGSLKASPGIASIWKLAPVVSYLQLRDLALDITFFGDGVYSISDLIGSRQESEGTDTGDEDETETVFPFALYGFEMTNATIVFDDREFGKKHVITDINLTVPFTSSFQDLRKEFTQPRFTAVVNGDPIELEGRTLPFDQTLLTEFQLGAVDVDLDQYWRYLPVETPLQLVKGRFSSDISLFFERPDAKRINLFLGGGGSLTDLELSAPDTGTVVSLRELNFRMDKYSLGENTLSLSRIVLDQPHFKIVRDDKGTINWNTYFPGSEMTKGGAKVQTKADESALLVDIKAVEVREGSFDWQDKAIPGGFTHRFNHFTLKASDLSTRPDKLGSWQASLGKSGQKLALQGKAMSNPPRGSVTVTGENIPLPRYRSYLDTFLPLAVENGAVSLSVNIDFDLSGETPKVVAKDGSLKLEQLVMLKQGEEKPSINLDRFEVAGAAMHLEQRTANVAEVRLTGPAVSVVREKSGTLDLARLFTGKEELEAERKVEEVIKPWAITIGKIHMTGGKVAYRDLAMKHPASMSLDDITADLTNLSTKEGETAQYAFSTRWAKKGEISLDGTLDIAPLKSSGRFRIKSMALRPFDALLRRHTELLFASGAAYTDLNYTFIGGEKPQFTVAGNVQLSNVRLKDNRGDGEFAGIDALKITGIRFANEPDRLSVANIHLDGPHAAIDFDEKGRLNIRRAFRIPEPPPVQEKEVAEKKKTVSSPAMELPKPKQEEGFFEAIDIGVVTMQNGRISFRDATVSPPYFTTISDMKLGLIEIALSQNARPKLDFTATLGTTPVSVTGSLNPVVTPIYSNLAISVGGMELAPISPYTVQHLAYPIVNGKLFADVKFKTEDWVLDANNKFYIERLELGPKDKRPDAPNVPVKFGLALLQDGNGNVEIDLPIKGRLDDPDFRIGGIVFKTIASLFVKALASPFSLIGSIFGGGGENMDFVVFQPGRHHLTAAGLQKLETTIKALKERKRLSLEVTGVIDPVSDKQGLVEVIFENKLKEQKFNSLSRKERAQTTVETIVVTPEEYEEFLFEAYAAEPDEEGIKPTTLFTTDKQPIEFMEKFILDRIEVTQEDLNALALSRAEAVKEHIVGRESELAERVLLPERRKNRKGKTGVPQHRADLGIK